MSAFDTFFDRLIGNEGGYSNRALSADPGGETNWGITWPKLREAIGAGLVEPETTIKNLTREQAKVIYRALFWDESRLDEMPPAIAFQVFDAAVNHGIPNGIRFLQRAAGVADDGHIGPVTIAAVASQSVTDILMLFIAARLDFWTSLSTWADNGKGWARRAANDLRLAAEDS